MSGSPRAPNSRRPRAGRPTTCSRQPMGGAGRGARGGAGRGSRGGAGRGYKRPRARGTHIPLRARSGRLVRRRRSARGPAGLGRCCGCGVCAAGAAAPKRCTTSGLGCVRHRPASPSPSGPRSLPGAAASLASPSRGVLSGPQWKLGFASLCWPPGSRRVLGDWGRRGRPRTVRCTLRVSGRGDSPRGGRRPPRKTLVGSTELPVQGQAWGRPGTP